jgi:FixJ family two-component response regulator
LYYSEGQDEKLKRTVFIKVIYMSGYTYDAIARYGILEEGLNFIQKPFSRKDLARRIREALD